MNATDAQRFSSPIHPAGAVFALGSATRIMTASGIVGFTAEVEKMHFITGCRATKPMS
jgi:hypothetical protein